jgi:hypothetical protein
MDLTAKIKSLGFDNVEAIPDQTRRGVTVYRIRTANGWTYERFASEADVDAWAINHRPE